jgi:hypothetical protein
MSKDDEWSPDEALGTETFRQGDVAEDEGERTDPVFREALEQDPSLEPALVADDLELRELGAQLDDPELLVTLEGGMDDPDGIDDAGPRRQAEDEAGWDLDASLSADEGDDGEDELTPG